MSISICMIMKNESENIDKYFDCTKFADEVIVIDTGSTDNTVNLLKEKGAIVHEHKWENSFSIARNYAQSYATKDWILWLDADDFIENHEPFLEISKTTPDKLYMAKIINGKNTFMQCRLYPNFKGLYWERRVHEQIVTSAYKKGLELSESDCIIVHNGVENIIDKIKKSKRNLNLLEMQIGEGDNHPQTIMELADSYMIIGSHYDGILNYNKITTPKNEKYFPELISFVYYKLAHHSLIRNLINDARCYYQCSCEVHERPDSLLGLAITSTSAQVAKQYLEKIVTSDWSKERYEFDSNVINKAKTALEKINNLQQINQ